MALYNNGYPATYQPYYQYQPQQAQQQTGIIWVQGEAGAKSYLVAPNSTVQLWDSERQTIYLKSADASGMPSIKTLDYTIREIPSNLRSDAIDDKTKYVTQDDLKPLYAQISALKKQISKEGDNEPAV